MNRQVAPDLTTLDSRRKTVRLSDYKGSVVLLTFWATYCSPCKIEMPWFEEFQEMYGRRKLVVLGAAVDDEGWSAVTPFLSRRNLNYRVFLADAPIIDRYGGIDEVPTTFVIDTEGRIAYKHIGLQSKATYMRELDSLLPLWRRTFAF